jgi:predicted RNA-binding Zn-ribbon protein involved in translation (DUF1610 family)
METAWTARQAPGAAQNFPTGNAMSIYNATCTNSECTLNFLAASGGADAVPGFCPKCGSAVIEKCPNCRVQLSVYGYHFCPGCGERLRFPPKN